MQFKRVMQFNRRSLLAFGALLATGAVAQAQNGFKAFGPPNPFGFPSYYQDFQDLQLTQCIDQDDPLCGIPPEEFLVGPPVVGPDPAQNNFLGESFYWLSIATLTVPNRGDALLVMAVEAVFGNPTEAIIDGDQTIFSRLRIRLDGAGFEAGFYRIETPYGTYQFDAPAVAAGRIINHTVDCLHVFQAPPLPLLICGSPPDGPGANYFTTPLGILDDGTSAPEFAPNGPNFLVWDPTVAPLAPPGYVGDPAILHPVIGAVAPNQNHFRVQYSPTSNFANIVFDERTDLFSTMGKIQPLGACDGVLPVANFGASPVSGIAPLAVNFTDLSSCVTEWSWDFGDGGSSSLQNPSHVYTAPGLYTVSLSVIGPGGADAITKVDLINVAPAPANQLNLGNPSPGTAGTPNSFVVTGAQPNRVVGIYIGQNLGSSVVNLGNCGGIPVGLAQPFRLLAKANANAAGVANFVTPVPAGAAGKTFRFQAVQPASCRTSSVVSEVF